MFSFCYLITPTSLEIAIRKISKTTIAVDIGGKQSERKDSSLGKGRGKGKGKGGEATCVPRYKSVVTIL